MELRDVVVNGDKATLDELQEWLDRSPYPNGRIVTASSLRLTMFMNPSKHLEDNDIHDHDRSGSCGDCNDLYNVGYEEGQLSVNLSEAIDKVAFEQYDDELS